MSWTPEGGSATYRCLVDNQTKSHPGHRTVRGFVNQTPSIASPSSSRVTIISFLTQSPEGIKIDPPSVSCQDLAGADELAERLLQLKNDPQTGICRLFLLENICSKTICLMGSFFDIDTQFFADHVSAPSWFRVDDISNKLQHLPSTRRREEHLQICFSDPRTIERTDNEKIAEPFTLGELELGPPAYMGRPGSQASLQHASGLNRGAGLLCPRMRNEVRFKQVLDIRYSITAWFREMEYGGDWTGRLFYCRIVAVTEYCYQESYS